MSEPFSEKASALRMSANALLVSKPKRKQMNAAVVEEFGKPLVLREWEIPTAGAGKIVVKT